MTTPLNLAPYTSIEHGYFVKLTVQELGLPVVIRFSSYRVPMMITESDGLSYSYNALGSILGVSQIVADSKSTLSDVTVNLSGIPNIYVADIVGTQIKAAPVEIRRAYFDASTGQLLAIPGNPSLSFSGYVTNYAFDEGWNDGSNQSVTTSIALICSSTVSVLQNKVAGRRTCRDDQNYWYPGDLSMNRVGLLPDVFFDFGGPTPIQAPVAAPSTSVRT